MKTTKIVKTYRPYQNGMIYQEIEITKENGKETAKILDGWYWDK